MLRCACALKISQIEFYMGVWKCKPLFISALEGDINRSRLSTSKLCAWRHFESVHLFITLIRVLIHHPCICRVCNKTSTRIDDAANTGLIHRLAWDTKSKSFYEYFASYSPPMRCDAMSPAIVCELQDHEWVKVSQKVRFCVTNSLRATALENLTRFLEAKRLFSLPKKNNRLTDQRSAISEWWGHHHNPTSCALGREVTKTGQHRAKYTPFGKNGENKRKSMGKIDGALTTRTLCTKPG